MLSNSKKIFNRIVCLQQNTQNAHNPLSPPGEAIRSATSFLTIQIMMGILFYNKSRSRKKIWLDTIVRANSGQTYLKRKQILKRKRKEITGYRLFSEFRKTFLQKDCRLGSISTA
jgi:hypothetical protein